MRWKTKITRKFLCSPFAKIRNKIPSRRENEIIDCFKYNINIASKLYLIWYIWQRFKTKRSNYQIYFDRFGKKKDLAVGLLSRFFSNASVETSIHRNRFNVIKLMVNRGKIWTNCEAVAHMKGKYADLLFIWVIRETMRGIRDTKSFSISASFEKIITSWN